jgi:actin-related protein 5
MAPEPEVTTLPSLHPPNPESSADYTPYKRTGVPIVIDNGSTTIRYGFATSQTPQSGPNIIAKYRDRRTNRPILLFGEAVEAETGAKSQAKTPWEGDVLLNFDALVSSECFCALVILNHAQEASLDHTFIRLGCDTETVEHPVIMTERMCTPIHSRACKNPFAIAFCICLLYVVTSELLFELYRVPRTAYCLDSMMSFYHNSHPTDPSVFAGDGCVISFNTASTSVIPVLSGRGIMSRAKRSFSREVVYQPVLIFTKSTLGCNSVFRLSGQIGSVEVP